jgi:hypothetical protein
MLLMKLSILECFSWCRKLCLKVATQLICLVRVLIVPLWASGYKAAPELSRYISLGMPSILPILYHTIYENPSSFFAKAYTLAYTCFGCRNSFYLRNMLFRHLKAYKCTVKRRPSIRKRKPSIPYANEAMNLPTPPPKDPLEKVPNAPPLELGTERPPKC